MAFLSNIIRFLGGATPTILIGVCLTSMLLLLIRNRIRFPTKYLWILWMCLISSGSLLVATGIVKGYETVLERQHQKEKYARLQDLTPGEIKVLKHYVRLNTRSVLLSRSYGEIIVASVLEDAGILHQSKVIEKEEGTCVYDIDDACFKYLKKNPKLLKWDKPLK